MAKAIERLRVGLIVATGRWGPSAHIPAIQNLPETELCQESLIPQRDVFWKDEII